MAKVRITQVRGLIDRPKDQKDTMKVLGLGRISKSSEFELNPQLQGMINKVNHLIKVEEI